MTIFTKNNNVLTNLYIGASIGKSFISKCIRKYQNNYKYTHVFYILNNDINDIYQKDINSLKTIEAWPKPLYTLGNVHHHKPNDKYKLHTSNTKFMIINLIVFKKQKQLIEEFLFNQVGKHYDFLGIFNFIIESNLQEQNKWFCSELLVAAFKYAGINIYKDKAYKYDIKDFITNLLNSEYVQLVIA